MIPTRYDTAVKVIQILCAAEALHGASVRAIAERARLPTTHLADPLRLLPITMGSRFVETAVAMTGDPALGLKAGRMTQLRRTMGVAGVAITHAINSERALEKTVEIHNRTSNVAIMHLEEDGLYTCHRFRSLGSYGVYDEQVTDFHLGISATTSERYFDSRSRLCSVEVPVQRLERLGRDVYEQVLGYPVVPNDRYAGVRYRSSVLASTLPIDADVFSALEPTLERELGEVSPTYELRDVVADVIERGLERAGVCPDLSTVARSLAMSPRTLQSRLRQEDTSLRRLLDVVRARMVARWLAQGFSREEVSCRLGFSDSAAFRRAVRRWAREGLMCASEASVPSPRSSAVELGRVPRLSS